MDWNPDDVAINPNASNLLFEKVSEEFGIENVKYDSYRQTGGVYDFPVRKADGRIISAFSMSDVFKNTPLLAIDYIFVNPNRHLDAEEWLDKNRELIITPTIRK